MNSEYIHIANITGATGHACDCADCRAMCTKTPCIGTPSDILRLINNGHIDKLLPTGWMAGLNQGVGLIPMVQPKRQENGHCAFLQEDGLCGVHAIKPTEGSLASHTPSLVSVALAVAKTWTREENAKTCDLIVEALQKGGVM